MQSVSQAAYLRTLLEEQQQHSSQLIDWELLKTVEEDFKTALYKNYLLRKGEFYFPY